MYWIVDIYDLKINCINDATSIWFNMLPLFICAQAVVHRTIYYIYSCICTCMHPCNSNGIAAGKTIVIILIFMTNTPRVTRSFLHLWYNLDDAVPGCVIYCPIVLEMDTFRQLAWNQYVTTVSIATVASRWLMVVSTIKKRCGWWHFCHSSQVESISQAWAKKIFLR